MDYPDDSPPDNPVAIGSDEPRRIRHPKKSELWDLTLDEAIHIALRNNKIIRSRIQDQQIRNPLISNPDQTPSRFDPSLQETGILFGQRGVEAALSDFDAQFSTSMSWGHNDMLENNPIQAGAPSLPNNTLLQDTAAFRAKLDKTFADSTELTLSNNWDYQLNNIPNNVFPSYFTGFARAEVRRPLLAGAGTDYTRIAGPIGKQTFGVGQGVVIARINNDIAVADFETAVHNLIRDVETEYWDLSLAYRSYHAQMISWSSALKTWRLINSKSTQGMEGGGAGDEAQARDNLFDAKSRAQDALGNIYSTEGQFRRLLGLPVNDGKIIVPSDEPAISEFIPDWHIAVAEGLTQRPEIRKQKWNIKSLELQLSAAKNLVQPRLDFVAGYQLNAFGNELISSQTNPFADGSSAFSTLAQAQQSTWNIGFEASVPIGLRNAHTQVRNYELRVAHARASLDTQEQDIAHEIRNAFQTLDRAYAVATDNWNRRVAADERVRAYLARYQVGGISVDPLLRAQQSRADAEVAYYRSITQYNQAITDFHYRTGSILREHSVTLAEDDWDPRAYADALRRAWARSHGIDNPLLCTAPAEFVVPRGKPVAALPLNVQTAGAAAAPRPTTGGPVPQPALPPARQLAPTPAAPGPGGGPSGLPQAWLQPPAPRGMIQPASAIGRPTDARANAFILPRVANPGPANPSVAPKLLPASMTETRLIPPNAAVAAPQENSSFLAPVSSPSPAPTDRPSRSAGSFADPPTNTSDAFDMPLNQLPQK